MRQIIAMGHGGFSPGFLKGSCSPHYDAEERRRPTFHQLISEGVLPDGYGIDEGAAAHFIDDQLRTVVTSIPDVTAYYVRKTRDGVVEQVQSSVMLTR